MRREKKKFIQPLEGSEATNEFSKNTFLFNLLHEFFLSFSAMCGWRPGCFIFPLSLDLFFHFFLFQIFLEFFFSFLLFHFSFYSPLLLEYPWAFFFPAYFRSLWISSRFLRLFFPSPIPFCSNQKQDLILCWFSQCPKANIDFAFFSLSLTPGISVFRNLHSIWPVNRGHKPGRVEPQIANCRRPHVWGKLLGNPTRSCRQTGEFLQLSRCT